MDKICGRRKREGEETKEIDNTIGRAVGMGEKKFYSTLYQRLSRDFKVKVKLYTVVLWEQVAGNWQQRWEYASSKEKHHAPNKYQTRKTKGWCAHWFAKFPRTPVQLLFPNRSKNPLLSRSRRPSNANIVVLIWGRITLSRFDFAVGIRMQMGWAEIQEVDFWCAAPRVQWP